MRRQQAGGTMVAEQTSNALHRSKLENLLNSEPTFFSANNSDDDNLNNQNSNHNVDFSHRDSSSSAMSPGYYDSSSVSTGTSPSPNFMMSPWNNQISSPFNKSPWLLPSIFNSFDDTFPPNGLIGSLVREEGHIYSLAVSGDLLYTGSDSKNIRVWKNLKEFTGFKSHSGLVKAIVIILGDRIFTGHQDGKIRIWKVSSKNLKQHKRIGTLPTLKDYVKSSMNPKNFVEIRRSKNPVRIKHNDAVSCISLNEEQGLLYSGSWDKTVKVWRIATSKCVESINAHDDAVNSVVSGLEWFVFTGSADGTVKMWRRELHGKGTKHFLAQVLLKLENAITALAINQDAAVLYCGSSDGLLNFWESEKHLSHGGVLRGHRLAILCLATGGNLVFSGSADNNICVWRTEEGGIHTCLSVLTGHTGPVKCLAVEEDRGCDRTKGDQRWIVYSGSLDRSVKVWRVAEYAPELKSFKTAVEEPCTSSEYDSPKASGVGRSSCSSFGGVNSMSQRQETSTRVKA